MPSGAFIVAQSFVRTPEAVGGPVVKYENQRFWLRGAIFGGLLEVSWGVLEVSSGVLEPSWGVLEASWGVLEAS